MKNRLNLDFNLESSDERSEFVNKYVEREEFRKQPLTAAELTTIADYILWGRNASGKNAVQEKTIQIATKHGTWDNTHETESLDALIESPKFNEAQISQHPTHYIQKAKKFSRDEALAQCPDHMKDHLIDLFQRIDKLDLMIEFYDLDHGKRTKDIRESLISKFSPAEQQMLREKASGWSSYYYLKRKHELVELRREQYTLRDSFMSMIQARNTVPAIIIPRQVDWDVEIKVLPLGLKNEQSKLLFRDADYLNPQSYTEDELKHVSKYYWEKKKNKQEIQHTFDFRDLECVYALFLAFFDAEDVGEIESIEGNAKYLIDTLMYYTELANLSDLHRELLNMKVRQVRNQEIANCINKKYRKNYTANYISTLFRQKIIPQINAAARIHEEVMGKIYFEEEFKTCSCCGRTYLRTTDFFVRKSRSRDGLSGRCKKCDKLDRNEKKVIKLVQR